MDNQSWIMNGRSVDSRLEALVSDRTARRMNEGQFSRDNVGYISKLDMRAVKEKLSISNERLERLRRLCQVWDVRLISKDITSHRKLIGPVIVAVKKCVRPLIGLFLRDTLHQQRTFNSEVLSLLASMSDEIARLHSSINGRSPNR